MSAGSDRPQKLVTGRPPAAPARLIFGFVAALAAAKLIACLVTGFGDDEAYTLVISRRLALHYFDHPPLHQWILHAFVAIAGEGHWDRIPFWAMQVATNLPLYALTRRLLDRDAAIWALFAFNASAYFLTMPDGYIMPDTPLLLALATAIWAVAEILFAPSSSERKRTWLWAVAGVSFGLAGLAKYSAVLAPIGLFGFLLFSPRHRRWFADPRPYAAAALALVVISPALIWNAENGWASLAFQLGRATGRAGPGLVGAISQILETLGAQIAVLSPWIALPTCLGLYRAERGGDGSRLLLWLAAPPLLLFALLPISGLRPIPHWFNSGWLFAFPLAGWRLAALSAFAQARAARIGIALSVATLALFLAVLTVGPAAFLPRTTAKFNDPTAFAFDWPSLTRTASWRAGAAPPGFVLVNSWRIGGRVGAALGPDTPICGFDADPRGLAYDCDPRALIGADAVLIGADATASGLFAAAAPYFEHIEAPETFTIGRFGRVERQFQVARARKLIAPFPLPYGLNATLSRR